MFTSQLSIYEAERKVLINRLIELFPKYAKNWWYKQSTAKLIAIYNSKKSN